MLRWLDVVRLANNGNPAPDRRVEKTPEEWGGFSRYRSIIFYRTEDEKERAVKIISEAQKSYPEMIVILLQKFDISIKLMTIIRTIITEIGMQGTVRRLSIRNYQSSENCIMKS